MAWSHWVSSSIWGQIENAQVPKIHLNSVIWSSNKPSTPLSNLLHSTQHTLAIWNNLKTRFQLKSTYSLNTIYLKNDDFHPGTVQEFYSRWQKTNLYTIKDLLSPTNTILTFRELSQKDPSIHLRQFKYFQLRHFVHPFVQRAKSSTPSPFELIARTGLPQKGLISRIYKLLMDPSATNRPKHPYMLKWEESLTQQLSMEDWSTIWLNAQKMVTCTRQKENLYKILMRWYHTPDKLHSLFPEHPNACWRQCGETGTLVHTFWSCPKLQKLWGDIEDLLTRVTNLTLSKDPLTYLLGKPFPRLPRRSQTLLNQILTATRIAIAAKWKSPDPPTLTDVIKRVNSNRYFEERMAFLQNETPKFLQVWSVWVLEGLAE